MLPGCIIVFIISGVSAQGTGRDKYLLLDMSRAVVSFAELLLCWEPWRIDPLATAGRFPSHLHF